MAFRYNYMVTDICSPLSISASSFSLRLPSPSLASTTGAMWNNPKLNHWQLSLQREYIQYIGNTEYCKLWPQRMCFINSYKAFFLKGWWPPKDFLNYPASLILLHFPLACCSKWFSVTITRWQIFAHFCLFLPLHPQWGRPLLHQLPPQALCEIIQNWINWQLSREYIQYIGKTECCKLWPQGMCFINSYKAFFLKRWWPPKHFLNYLQLLLSYYT